MLGLRLVSGVDVAAFERRFGLFPLARRAPSIGELQAEGLLKASWGRLRIAPQRLLLASEVARRLL
jgi:coproporphyrinogen III oxidase-like Fe-S oxidoreductase